MSVVAAGAEVVKEEKPKPDLSEWPCTSWCHFDKANCVNAWKSCRGCDSCDTRPHVCLVWGTRQTLLNTLEFCSADPGAGDWCMKNKDPTPSTLECRSIVNASKHNSCANR